MANARQQAAHSAALCPCAWVHERPAGSSCGWAPFLHLLCLSAQGLFPGEGTEQALGRRLAPMPPQQHGWDCGQPFASLPSASLPSASRLTTIRFVSWLPYAPCRSTLSGQRLFTLMWTGRAPRAAACLPAGPPRQPTRTQVGRPGAPCAAHASPALGASLLALHAAAMELPMFGSCFARLSPA